LVNLVEGLVGDEEVAKLEKSIQTDLGTVGPLDSEQRVFDLEELFDATETRGRLKPFPGKPRSIA
jgi:hypothetical protein